MFLNNYFRGALTSKPYAFLARPWEFKSVDSIDFFDSLGSNIRVDLRGDKILRILPRSNDSINEDWISDKIRFICDAARLQRLDSPILKLQSSFFNVSWTQVFDFLTYLYYNKPKKALNFLTLSRLNSSLFLSGLFTDLDAASLTSRLCLNFFYKNSNTDTLLLNYKLGLDRNFFLFNKKFDDLINFQNLVLVDVNIKTLAPVLAVRLRGLAKAGIKIYNFGRNSSQPLFCDVGSSVDFNRFISGKHWLNSKLLREKSFFLINDSFNFNTTLFRTFLIKFNLSFGVFSSNVGSLNLKEYSAFNNLLDISLNNGLNFVNYVQTNCSTSFCNTLKAFDKVSFLNSFRVSLVSHGGDLAESSDFLVPISSPFEQSKNYLNVLGFKQKTRLCFSSPNNVLDHSDFLMFLYSSFLKHYLLNFNKSQLNFILLLYLSYFGKFYLNSLDSKVWNLINYFFDAMENKSFVLSHFMLFIAPDLNFLLNEISQSQFLFSFDEKLGTFIMPVKLKSFGLLNNRLLSDDNFYQSDEISLVSSTLSGASNRLINKASFSF